MQSAFGVNDRIMDMLDKKNTLDPQQFEEVIKVQDYQSSDELKTDIWKIINNRQQSKWRLFEIVSKGPFISIVFKQNEPS